ncbi:MAG: sigma-70 family RNA polymerase sigma factor [Myxococcota bacterium]
MSETSDVMALSELGEIEVPKSEPLQVDALYRRYHDLVYRLALRYGSGNAAWAEDVTQEVFLRLFDAIDRLDERDGLEGWFYRVTSNYCLNRLRRQRVRNAAPVRWLLGEKVRPPVDPERLIAAREGLDQASTVLERLPPKERIAFCMVHIDGKTLVEIGGILGHSKGYVCKLVKRAEARVRAQGWEVGDA